MKRTISFGNISTSETYVKVSYYQEKFKDFGCFFKCTHAPMQTRFDFTKAQDCKLLTFDKDFKFVSIRSFFNDQNKPFSFIISDPYVVILNPHNKWQVEGIKCIELKESPMVICGDHFFATDAEKVEILATNPYRFYLTFNLWIGRNLSRIIELDKIYQRAKENNQEKLCNRIEEVKKLLFEYYK